MIMNNAALGPINAAKILIMARMVSITREMIPTHLRLRRRLESGKHAHNPKRESLRPIA